MKRSGSVVLTSVMMGSGMTLGACGGEQPASQWVEPPAATAEAADTEGRAYANLQECRAAGDFAPAECDQAFAAAQAQNEQNAPRFADQQTCEERYGVDQCVPRNNGSFFTPLLTGFIVGQALGNLGGPRYYGAPYYRDRYGQFYGPGGRAISRNYVTGRPRVGREVLAPPRAQAPSRAQSRSAVISRGGFGGGGGRSYGG